MACLVEYGLMTMVNVVARFPFKYVIGHATLVNFDLHPHLTYV